MKKLTGQNRSSAVMAQRHEAMDSLDDFPTPPWATRALLAFLKAEGIALDGHRIAEPCANRGYMVRPLQEVAGAVIASDIFDYGMGYSVRDFLSQVEGEAEGADDVVTNPPFNLSVAFALEALRRVEGVVALFLRSSWAEGGDRFQRLFNGQAPTYQLIFSERVILAQGVLRDPDRKYWFWSKKKKAWELRKPSTATSYSWFVWDPRSRGRFCDRTTIVWIPPGSRLQLTRPGDYDQVGIVTVRDDGPGEPGQDSLFCEGE